MLTTEANEQAKKREAKAETKPTGELSNVVAITAFLL
jgi:hypothetical protein